MSEKTADEVYRRDRIAEGIAQIKYGEPQRYAKAAKKIDRAEILAEKASDKNVFTAEGDDEGDLLGVMYDAGAVELWSSEDAQVRRYMADPETILEAKESFEVFESRFWEKPEIRASLIAAQEYLLDSDPLNYSDFRALDEDVPSTSTVESNFESWNRALIKSGLNVKGVDYAKEDVQDALRRKVYEDGELPICKEFYSDPSMPTEHQVLEHFESWTELLTSEFPHRVGSYEEDLNGDHHYDILVEGEFEQDKWKAELSPEDIEQKPLA